MLDEQEIGKTGDSYGDDISRWQCRVNACVHIRRSVCKGIHKGCLCSQRCWKLLQRIQLHPYIYLFIFPLGGGGEVGFTVL